MKNRFTRITTIAALVTVVSAGAARAQGTLALTIDPTTGPRGTVVNGQVDPADVAANCVTDLGAFQARFADLLNGPFVGGDTVGELPQTWFPDPNNITYENTNQMAYVITLAAVLGIAADIQGATAAAFPQTFVLTFADLAQNPVGELGHFDPVTGVGSVVTPDVVPGPWPVAAVCVAPLLDLDALRAGIEKNGAFFTDIGLQFGIDGPNSPEFEAFAQSYLGSSNTGFELLIEFTTAVGPTLVQNIVSPEALGVQFFTVTTPTLGFTIDPTSGPRGTVVNGQVDPADIAAHCVTDLGAFQARFQDLFAGPFVNSNTEGELPQTWFPDPNNIVYENDNQMAYIFTLLAILGIAQDINGATADAFPQTFVMTFAELDQTPVGELGHFDPVTGVGSVVTPDVTPGPWPVAAACVRPLFDLDALRAGIERSGQFLADIGLEFGLDGPNSPEFEAFAQDYLGSSNTGFDLLIEFATVIGPTVVQNIVTPEALGVQFFTVTTPTLGFTIDPTSGLPGETVNGQVDPADVAEHCVTELEPFQAQFQQLLEGPFDGGNPSGDLFSRFFTGDDFIFENIDQTAYSITGIIALGIGQNIGGAAETAFPQTFVMTFADLQQNPIGELGQFDPVTGVGSVTVPNIAPGLHPVAAACVRPVLDLDLLEAAIRRNGDFLESLGMPFDINTPEFQEFLDNFPGANGDLFTFLNLIGPSIIQNIVSPAALGVQFFTVLADVDHFQCYRARTTGFSPVSVTLSDVFGNRPATVRRAIDVCAPADKNGEDPEAPNSPAFLTAYKLTARGPFPQVQGVSANNQFGSVTLNVKRPKALLVPTTASLDGPPASPDGAFLNHFNCYAVRVANNTPKPTPGTVTVETALETVQIRPSKPSRLCVSTSKNGEPVTPSRPENLLCYKTKSSPGPKPAATVFLSNQFGQQVQRLGARGELCVPTELTP